VNILALLVVILVGGLILVAVVSAGSRRPAPSGRRGSRGGPVSKISRQDMRNRWDQVISVSQTGGSGLKSSILEADKLLDQALKQCGMPGDTMGDRLKNARNAFSSRSIYDGVWRAHKLRNTMAHEVGFDLVPSQVREALADFERGLKDLGVM